ncbi:glycosyltransferase family 4 protein [Tropicibacter oceani]|uniref:Glycosyltransferase family 1 protein n=1 Tax=Tropicibacter oceani TaxID=3058420 RepID=A0ABY8QIC4_9RHOB|nr:glycosyltransferase family 1 protein [Tropicibacter oceani]WGW04385.1 glycosyltransferase family 1 protein [Tropicibacter oceani]
MDITTNSAPSARLLDLTRLTRRAGRPFTGVDRVEKAYLDQLLTLDTPLFGLVKSAFGYVLLDRAGCAVFHKTLETGDFGPADRLSSVKRGLDPMRARAESDLRRICLDRCLPIRLSRMLRRHLPPGVHYLNVGHSNLTERVLSALRLIRDSRTAVLIHDTIPLDHPEYQRPETARSFKVFLQTATRHADLILCNSAQTQSDVLRHAAPLMPKTVVAHLGVPMPRPGTPPSGAWDGHPYFVCLGTIEPRKNHALLLDLWQDIPDAHLLICGNRGWENDAVLARLDAKPPRVHELPGLDDGQVFGLLQGSRGLLFPSLAEGYGLPPIEAAALGVPALCNDLPIYREVLGNIPVYAPASDRYLWAQEIRGLAGSDQTGHGAEKCDGQGWSPPSWDAHFKTVLTMI